MGNLWLIQEQCLVLRGLGGGSNSNTNIQTEAKSLAKLNYRHLTKINFRHYRLSLLRTLTRGPEDVRIKGVDCRGDRDEVAVSE